jgi:hypothetical protein
MVALKKAKHAGTDKFAGTDWQHYRYCGAVYRYIRAGSGQLLPVKSYYSISLAIVSTATIERDLRTFSLIVGRVS